MQEKNMGHICPIGRSGVNYFFYILRDIAYSLAVSSEHYSLM